MILSEAVPGRDWKQVQPQLRMNGYEFTLLSGSGTGRLFLTYQSNRPRFSYTMMAWERFTRWLDTWGYSMRRYYINMPALVITDTSGTIQYVVIR